MIDWKKAAHKLAADIAFRAFFATITGKIEGLTSNTNMILGDGLREALKAYQEAIDVREEKA